jgi:hypothetical protein
MDNCHMILLYNPIFDLLLASIAYQHPDDYETTGDGSFLSVIDSLPCRSLKRKDSSDIFVGVLQDYEGSHIKMSRKTKKKSTRRGAVLLGDNSEHGRQTNRAGEQRCQG